MSHGPSRIPTKGCCIYCGKTNVRLTDEHFLPFSLGGQHIIEKASCLACADITKKFEQDVAREMWGDARISHNAPSRRKGSRATHITLRDPDNPDKMIRVPYDEYPAPFIFYKMHRAGLLEGLPDDVDISGAWQFVALMDNKKADEFEQKFGMKLTAKFRHVPESFGRLIAKIGYGQILCSLDPGEFRPLCLPYIMGQQKNVSYIVGGSFELPEPAANLGYVLNTMAFGDRKRIFLIAEVRLYANLKTPVYHVVVGDVVGENAVSAVWKKLNGVKQIMLPPSFVSRLSKQPHWLPPIWPLPF